MQNAKNKKHERLLYPVSNMQPRRYNKDWSTITEAFEANDYRKIRLLGACSLLFSSPGSFTTAMLVDLSAKTLQAVVLPIQPLAPNTF
jgi:hypothetical protein